MKKYLIMALFIGAFLITAPLAAQDDDSVTVTCPGCTHTIPIYMGDGGFIATATEGTTEVAWVAQCGSVSMHGELTPGEGSVVSSLFNMENGLGCNRKDGGSFEIGPVMDGGWYWLNGDVSSAVGNLIDKKVTSNKKVTITDAGDSIETVEGDGAVLLKQASTGRMGLLPNILPVPEMDPVAVNTCSFTGTGAAAAAETSNCMLGNGGSTLQVQGPTNVFTGKRPDLGANAMVTRPASGEVTVQADLWGNGTGHYTAGTVDNAGATPANLGHAGGTRLAATIQAALASTGPGAGTDIDGTGPGGNAGAGLTFDNTTTTSLGELTIAPDASYCNPTAKPPVNHTATVTFRAELSTAQQAQVVPSLTTTPAATDGGVAARHTIMIVCPSASANMGTELVPENPFPTDK